MEETPIDFDKGDINTGTEICIFTNLDNTWKRAVVQEIDLSERELLVDFSNGTQEWISFDGRKICYPPKETKLTRDVQEKKYNSTKLTDSAMNNSIVSSMSKKKTGSIKKFSKKKSIPSTKVSSSMQQPTSIWRLRFKSNEALIRTNNRTESKKRKRESAGYDKNISVEVLSSTSNAEIPQKRKKISKGKTNIDEQSAINFSSPADANKRKKSISRDVLDTSLVKETVDLSLFTAKKEKKIKTLLPKRNVLDTCSTLAVASRNTTEDVPVYVPPLLVPPILPESPIIRASNPTAGFSPELQLVGTSQLTSSRFVCPKQDCKKHFRNENLLMMHIKHYHREYRNILSSTPNVADLAYARTIGEQIESPQGSFLERIAKLEEDRLISGTSTPEPRILEMLNNSAIDNKQLKTGNKKVSASKRFTNSETVMSPKMPLLVAQLQEPPLIPPTITIQSEVNSEFCVSQSRRTSVSPQHFSDFSNPVNDAESRNRSKKCKGERRRFSQMDIVDVINCLCGYFFEDGLMIQCDLCQCWQHGACIGFESENEVPPNYTCETCRHPKRCHQSKKYLYVQNWMRDGIIPSFSFSKLNEEVSTKRSEFLKSSHQYLCELVELKHAIRNLQVKIQILRQTPDHPKLYLWAKSWNNEVGEEVIGESTTEVGPIPEVAINMDNCRKHLSEHIDEELEKAECLLQSIEEKFEKMDDLDGDDEIDEEDSFHNNPEMYISFAKEMLVMIMRDLSNIQKLKYCDR